MNTACFMLHPASGRPSNHPGVVCDNCHARETFSVRFKCLDCPDYDLWFVCYLKNIQLFIIIIIF